MSWHVQTGRSSFFKTGLGHLQKKPADVICVLRTTCALSLLTHCKPMRASDAWQSSAVCGPIYGKVEIHFFLRKVNFEFSKK